MVTGAGSSQGIGFATARALTQLGARVFLTSLSGRVNERVHEISATGAPADLTDGGQLEELIVIAVAKRGIRIGKSAPRGLGPSARAR